MITLPSWSLAAASRSSLYRKLTGTCSVFSSPNVLWQKIAQTIKTMNHLKQFISQHTDTIVNNERRITTLWRLDQNAKVQRDPCYLSIETKRETEDCLDSRHRFISKRGSSLISFFFPLCVQRSRFSNAKKVLTSDRSAEKDSSLRAFTRQVPRRLMSIAFWMESFIEKVQWHGYFAWSLNTFPHIEYLKWKQNSLSRHIWRG